MDRIIADNMGLNLENVHFVYAFQNFLSSSISFCHLYRYKDWKKAFKKVTEEKMILTTW